MYETLDECIASGQHLTECDDDGYCNYCGEQDDSREYLREKIAVALHDRLASPEPVKDDDLIRVGRILLGDANTEIEAFAKLGSGKKKVSRLNFEIITTDEWSDDAINTIQEEFEGMYSGNLNIASACMTRSETISDPNE